MEDNKINLVFFEGTSVRKLYNTMKTWQQKNRKRLLSINIQKDGDTFCCIALTNPSEVIITDIDGDQAVVQGGAIWVKSP